MDYTKASNIWQYGGNYTKIYRRHTFQMGVNFATNNANAEYLNSSVTFSSAQTANVATAYRREFDGVVRVWEFRIPCLRRNVLETEHGGWVDGAYFMDSWRATDKLTINLGLRYDLTLMPIYGEQQERKQFRGRLWTPKRESTISSGTLRPAIPLP